LHLGGCAFGPLALATLILWWIDALLGTFSYSLVLPLAAIGLLQGLTGALAMALLSTHLLRQPGVGSQTRNFLTTCGLTLYTIMTREYAAPLSGRSVLAGMRGRDSAFVRTPKRDRLPSGSGDAAGPNLRAK